MNEKRFEDDGVEYNNNYNYALLDTYYEFDGKMIIEWNKHSDNVEYTDFGRITEILNIKQMRLESLMKHREEIGKLFDRIDEQQSTIQRMKHSLNTIYKAFEKHYGYDMRNAVWLIDELNDEIVDELYIAETDSKNRKEASMYWKKKVDEQQELIESLKKDVAYYEKLNENRLMNTKGMFDEK